MADIQNGKPCLKVNCSGTRVDWTHLIESHFYLKKSDREAMKKLLREKIR